MTHKVRNFDGHKQQQAAYAVITEAHHALCNAQADETDDDTIAECEQDLEEAQAIFAEDFGGAHYDDDDDDEG